MEEGEAPVCVNHDETIYTNHGDFRTIYPSDMGNCWPRVFQCIDGDMINNDSLIPEIRETYYTSCIVAGDLKLSGNLLSTRDIYSGTNIMIETIYEYGGNLYNDLEILLATPFDFELISMPSY